MTHLTKENLIATCECFLKLHRPTFAEIASASFGGSASTLFAWRAKCKKDMADNLQATSPFYFRWREVDDWWLSHIERAIRELGTALVQQVKAEAVSGIPHVVRDANQRIIYKLDPQWIGYDDFYVELSTGCAPYEVARKRLLLDEHGNPIPELRVESLPSAIRLRVLEVIDPAFRSTQNVNVDSRVSVVHSAAPLQRRSNEVKPEGIPELRRLALMSPEERRAELKASAYPKNEKGLIAPANTGAGRLIDEAPAVPRPSYAKPAPSLDQAGTGRGVPPPGGMRVR
jgi:hypothetical protein